MFIGHFGTGFAVKKIAPAISLGTLFLAAQFIDLIWPILLLLGIEQVLIEPGNTMVTPLNFTYYPFTHSLLAVVVWGIIIGVIYYLFKKNFWNSVWLGLLVPSHWVLDLLTHRPDLPLMPGSEIKVGLGLWDSLMGTVVIEVFIFISGVYLYLKATRAKNRTGSIALWTLVLFLVLVYISNLVGPPPPSSKMIAWVGLTQWLLVFWAYWIDRNRESNI
jgi:membrane-bound metal-dependent hydrolase YbcI (DUF457 family)